MTQVVFFCSKRSFLNGSRCNAPSKPKAKRESFEHKKRRHAAIRRRLKKKAVSSKLGFGPDFYRHQKNSFEDSVSNS
jgi:hypothetical protein